MAVLIALIVFSAFCFASGTYTTIGNYGYYTDYSKPSNNYTVTKVGRYDYYSTSSGKTYTGTKIGNYYYLND